MPSHGSDDGLFAEGESEAHHDTLNQFEHSFKLPVDLGLFGFGIANAGVEFSSMGNATIAVLFALAIGKTGGIFFFSMLGHKLGFPLPAGMGWRSLMTAGCVAGLGLTVALFVAGVAFTEPGLQGAAKMGALLSAFIAPIAIFMGRALGVRQEFERLSREETRIVEDMDISYETPAQEIPSEYDEPRGLSSEEEQTPLQ
jgi:NhaA family Na+:H+ antiporter